MQEVSTRSPTGIELALWFHDVMYDPKQKDNEIQSAHLAKTLLRQLGLNDELIDHVADFILMTRHQSGTFPSDGQLLLDIDLSILGSSELHYTQYATAIRKEFHWVSDADYRFGRSQFLKTFLDRPDHLITFPANGIPGSVAFVRRHQPSIFLDKSCV